MSAGRRGGTAHRSGFDRGRSVTALLVLLFTAVLPFLSCLLLTTAAAAVDRPPAAAAGRAGAGAPAVAGAAGPAGARAATAGAAGAAPVVDPDSPYVGYLRTAITGITPTVVTSSTGPTITVSGTMTNTSRGTIYDLRYVWQRGNALTGVKAIRAEIAQPSAAAAVVGEDSRVLGPTAPPAAGSTSAGGTSPGTTAPGPSKQVDLAPGASAAFVATIAIGSEGLQIDGRGVYPLTVKVTGDIGQNGITQYERVGEIHLLGTVLSVPLTALPAAGAAPATSANPTTTGPTATATADAVPATVLWPVVDTPHEGIDGVFLDDSLAAALAPGGRLFGVLSALSGFSTGGAAVTLVVDPQLLQEVETMAGGYRVVATPGAAQPALTPTSAPTTATGAPGTTLHGPASSTGVPTLAARSTSTVSNSPASSSAATAGATSTSSSSATSTGSSTGGPTSGSTDTAATNATPPSAQSSGTTTAGTATRTVPTTPTHTTTPSAATPSSTTASTGTASSGGIAAGGPSSTATTATRSPGPPPAGTVAGTGQAAAAVFLATLRAATRLHQVLVLPYSDPDSVAMMRAGLDDQLAALISRGRTVATRVLQVQPGDPGLITDTLVPAGGVVNDATLAYVSAHGIDHAVLSPGTVRHAGGPVGAVAVDESADDGALVTAALTDADVLAQLTDLVVRGRSAGLPTRLGTVAALLAGGSFDRTGTPVVLLPDRRWTANAAGLSALGSLLQTLATGKVVAAVTLPAVTATAAVPATLTYSAAAEAAELPPSYLGRVLADTSAIAAVGKSLIRAQTPGAPVPADVLDPLRTGLTSTAAAALRPDQNYGTRILQTVDDTLANLRGRVSIVSQSPSTLAASTAPLLITVRNDLPYSVRVRVVVIDGESVGMTTKDPALEDIPEGGTHQFRIDASVVKAGRFQVHARIEAADGSIWSAPTTITVSSSAYGALTIVLVAVAGGALTLMVALRLVQRVRNRKTGDDGGLGADRPDGPPPGPEPDSILAAANESTRRSSGDGGAPGNQGAADASVSPASPTATAPSNEQGEPPR